MSMKAKDEITVPITLSLSQWTVVLAAIEMAGMMTGERTHEVKAASLQIQKAIFAHAIKHQSSGASPRRPQAA